MSSYFVIGDIKSGGKHHGQNQILKYLGESHGYTQPNVLYIGAAAGNSHKPEFGFKGGIRKIFPGGNTSSLLLAPEDPTTDFDQKGRSIQKAFAEADMVYFDGGDVPVLKAVFDKFRLKEYCSHTTERGALVGGLCGGGSILASEVIYYDVQINSFVRDLGIGLVKPFSISCHMDRSDEFAPRFQQLKNAAYGGGYKALGLGVDQAVVFNAVGAYAVLPETSSQEEPPFYVQPCGNKKVLEARLI